jgi:hypothetical protein
MANELEVQSPSGIPLKVEMYGDILDGGELPSSTQMARSASVQPESKTSRGHSPVVIRETHTVEIEHDEDADAELDEIIDRVIEVVKARRAGQAPPPRRSRKEREADAAEAAQTALANPAQAALSNPNKKALMYAGVGVGAVAIIGGLWWYFKKK